ncbi:MAG: hypothetical protein ABIR08_13375 [Sphingomonas sp.]
MQRFAADTIAPYKQGDLDGLCGVYAIINALRLTVSGIRSLSHRECATLFEEGVELIVERNAAPALRDGIDLPTWLALAKRLCASASAMTSLRLKQVRPFAGRKSVTRRALLSELEGHVDRGLPVALHLSGAYDHFTVLIGHTDRRLNLYDSGGCRWIGKDKCGTPRSSRRHRIDPKAVTIFVIGK